MLPEPRKNQQVGWIGIAEEKPGDFRFPAAEPIEIADESADVPEETAQMPALDENGAVDDEDTLSGLEGIPAVDTMIMPSIEAQAVVEPPRRRSRWLSLLIVLVVVLVLLAVAAGLYWALYL